MSEKAHARLSPSSSARWMACPGSTVLEAGEPNNDNEHSKQGSLAHAVAAHCLQKKIDSDNIMFFPFRGKDEIVTMEMRDFIQEYLDFVREKARGGHLMVEQGLELGWLTGEENAEGTADAVIIQDDGDTLILTDFKYGFQEISAQENSQLRIYGLCASEVFSMLGDFKKFKLGVFQPRIQNFDSETITAEEMQKFEKKVRDAVKRVEQARKSNSLDGYLKTGDHCRWCRAAGTCPLLASEVADATGADFDDEDQKELIAPVELSKAGAKLGLVEIWGKGVRAKIESELMAGRPVKDWKLVQGKMGNRGWIDEADAKQELKKLNVPVGAMEEKCLLSPAKLEKVLKKTGNEDALAKLPELYSQKPGKPGVAPLSDKRPAYTVRPEDDFADVE